MRHYGHYGNKGRTSLGHSLLTRGKDTIGPEGLASPKPETRKSVKFLVFYSPKNPGSCMANKYLTPIDVGQKVHLSSQSAIWVRGSH